MTQDLSLTTGGEGSSSDSCVTEYVNAFEIPDCSKNKDARCANSADDDSDDLSRHTPNVPGSRLRAASCNSIFTDRQRRRPRPSISPLVSQDDSALGESHHAALSAEEHQLHNGQNMGIAVRRILDINLF